MAIKSVMPSSHLILCHPLLLPPSIFPGIKVFSSESGICISWPKYWSLALASVLPMNIQDWLPLGWTCRSRDFQESSPTPQFKSISSSALSFLYSPTFTSIHDYWNIYWRFTEPSPAHQNKTQFPLIQSLPSGSFHKPLILIHQRADRLKATITEN